jgi:putative oxidoreductase
MVTLDLLLTILRVLVGLLLFGHGAQKFLGWFGGKGLTAADQMVGHLGFRPVRFWSLVLSLVEFLGGLSLALGFLIPIGAAVIIGDMVMAIIKVHASKGLWAANGGFEYNLLIIASSLVFGLAEPQLYSLDHLLNISWAPGTVFVISGVIVLIGVIVGLLTTIHMPSHQQTTQTS